MAKKVYTDLDATGRTITATTFSGNASTADDLTGGNSTTLLGAVPYQSGTNITTLLSPNTTSTKKFLTQTGTGTNGAAPAWGTIAAGDVPTLNQNTTGSAATWTTARLLGGNSVNGSADVGFANKFIVQGTVDAGLSGAQFLGALGTGIVKNTTSTGVLSIAVAGTDYVTPSGNITGTASYANDLTGGNSTTLLGSIPYQSAVDTTTLLSPNTTTTKKFLSQTGTGTNGAIPSWDTLANSDIPTALSGKTYEGMTISATASTTMTFPTTTATIARTDAAQTFTGTQTFSGQITANGNIATSGTSTLTILTANQSSTTASANVIMRSGNQTGTAVSGNVTVTTGTSAAAATGAMTMGTGNATGGASGNVSILTGTTTTSGNSGTVHINVGTAVGTAGAINIGTAGVSNTTAPSAITLGTSAITVAVPGQLDIGGGYGVTGTSIFSSGGVSTDGALITGGTLQRTALNDGVTTSTATINTAGQFIRTTSSARYKQDIVPANFAYEDVLALEPKVYRLKYDMETFGHAREHAGFIAEEVDQISTMKVFVNYATDENGDLIPDGLNYDKMVSALVSAIKHQDGLIKSLTARIEALETP